VSSDVLTDLETGSAGLSAAAAAERLQRVGPNRIAREQSQGLIAGLLERLANPLNILMLTLATVSWLIGDHEAASIIIGMVVLSVSLSYVQEHRSNKAAERLRALVHTYATVRRRSGEPAALETTPEWREIPIHELVPGDILHLSAGDIVPADLRLLSAKDLYISEASLTGEALPVNKDPGALTDPPGEAGALTNICFMGTSVISGSAEAVVLLTGRNAYFGAIADLIAADRTETDFDRGVSRFAWLMIRTILVMAPLVFLINGFTKGNWIEAFLFAVAVAVGLTPEMLPMIVTVNLGKGALAMSRKKVIVKRLNAIQNFGAMDVLCTDKTGTLTQDRIILEKHVDLTGEDSDTVLLYAYLNSHHQSGLKNLLDVAVLNHPDAQRLEGIARQYVKFDEVPFDFNRRRMSVAVEGAGERLLICKGAVEELYAISRYGHSGGTVVELDDSHREALRATSVHLNEDGFRVIAIAYRSLSKEQTACTVADEADLTLLGYIAFLDPPKDSVREALTALGDHGVAVKVLTGDNEIVTRKICQQVGLDVSAVVLGPELAAMDATGVAAAVERGTVFAKLSPSQKADVIRALQNRGHVVGFLGDGINDGPALKAADVGLSVDSAVDIAKESADIILLEKSLLVLDEGVIEGRKVFGNIIKYIRMGASSNFGNMFSVLGASAWLPFLPMAPVQVLTNNLLYDFSQTAIPTDLVDDEYLVRPRRWELGNIGRFMLCIGPVSSLFDYVTYGLLYFVYGATTVAQASLFQTGWFVESLLSQTLIIHVIRTRQIPFLQSRASNALLATSAIICAVGLWLPVSPFAPALGFVPLPHSFYGGLGLILLAYLGLTQWTKSWFFRRFGLG
jgi:Mg2+-importing ATPase